MTDREKMIELLDHKVDDDWYTSEEIADYLIANGVTIPVRCKDCRYYNDDGEYCGMWGAVRHPEHFCDEGASENK